MNCQSQAEADNLWQKLSAGGEEVQCGWLKDKYALSWQIIPSILIDLLRDPDSVKSQRVMQAMFKMKKIDIAALKKAYEQE